MIAAAVLFSFHRHGGAKPAVAHNSIWRRTEGAAMDTIRESARTTPVVADVDLCVVGGSATGVFAAVTAARLGLKVALVELNGFFGGVAAAGLVSIWHTTLDTEFKQTIIAGLTTEVIERLRKRQAVDILEPDDGVHYVLNTEELKIELDALVTEAGVRPMLHTQFVAPVVQDGRLAAAIVEDKSGRRAIRAKFFVDATGDGDLVARAGLPCETWTDLQPPTTCMIVHGLAAWRKANPDLDPAAAAYDNSDGQEIPRGFFWGRPRPGGADLTMIAGTRVPGADCSDADQLTAAEIEGRRQVRVICDRWRRAAGGAGLSLQQLPATIGIRDTRHAVCLHRLTEREVLDGVRFDDAIANGSYRVDVHHSDKPGLTFRYLDGRELYVVPGRPTENGRWREATPIDPTFYQVPYRSLVPRGATNVLVAGRLMDADRGAYGAVRVMVNCNQTGEAAGAAAFVALDSGAAVADLDVSQLRDVLQRQGAQIL
ncbi:MAG: FAD-dependent oxidoreductase [Planctomycetes bacterium]|nr:FAD-dependent oxidoreductase [Planctomycetota bacterium]